MATHFVKSPTTEHEILLFDGVCNLCNWATQFVIKRDPSGWFKFAALQSTVAETLARERGVSIADMGSFVLISGDCAYTKSSAALRVVKHLQGLWPLLSVGLLLPADFRDLIYDFIARNRYRWFGRRESCIVPSPETSARFL